MKLNECGLEKVNWYLRELAEKRGIRNKWLKIRSHRIL